VPVRANCVFSVINRRNWHQNKFDALDRDITVAIGLPGWTERRRAVLALRLLELSGNQRLKQVIERAALRRLDYAVVESQKDDRNARVVEPWGRTVGR
jgi:hypothetical protein